MGSKERLKEFFYAGKKFYSVKAYKMKFNK